jgi:hypothetical protein
MPYAPFQERFPEIARKETRAITVLGKSELPRDTYGLVEAYCDEPGCDCRRVFLNVVSTIRKKVLATIAFGWESKKYYAKWMGDNDPEVIEGLMGPALNLASPQSELAPALLDQVRAVLQDKKYVERLKRHYGLFRDAIEREEEGNGRRGDSTDSDRNVLPSLPRVGRNDPCPCGSGKKYKKCCLV